MAKSIVNFFQDEANLKFLTKLRNANVKMATEKSVISQILAGKSVVDTGTLQTWDRREIEQLIDMLAENPLRVSVKKLPLLSRAKMQDPN
jgi:DNA ligase (NAD+)